MKVTKELLNELGVCHDYLQKFIRAFPVKDERFADGVEATGDVCAEHAAEFDWSWAADVMLAPEAYQQWRNTVNEGADMRELVRQRDEAYDVYSKRSQEWRERHNESYTEPNYRTPDAARAEWQELADAHNRDMTRINDEIAVLKARLFGQLFEDPENRSNRVIEADEHADRQRQANERRELVNARDRVTALRREQEKWTTEPPLQLERIGRELPEAENELTRLEQLADQRKLRRAEERVRTAQRALEVAQDQVARAQQAEAELREKTESVTTGA